MTTSFPIQFGTSGHRGIMGSGFTHDHVRAIAQAVAGYLYRNNTISSIIIGYDPRSGNDPKGSADSYTGTAINALLEQGIDVWMCEKYTPTPVVSWAIGHFQLGGGLILTASHNPPQYNGIKFNPSNGAPAPTAITQFIETKANQYLETPLPPQAKHGQLKWMSPSIEFARALIESLIKHGLPPGSGKPSDIPFAVDAKHGAVAFTWVAFSVLLDWPLTCLNLLPLPDFGGIEPNPVKTQFLDSLKAKQQTIKAPLAISNDPDGDRHQILDENGSPLSPEETCLIIAHFLVQTGLPLAGISTTLASSLCIKRFCDTHKLEFDETAVGFKYFAPALEKAKEEEKLWLGVESSGGFSASFHTLEKCGFLPGIWLMFIIHLTQKPLSQLKQEIKAAYGTTVFIEDEVALDEASKVSLKASFKALNADEWNVFAAPITRLSNTDGLKLYFDDGSWILCRLSGTEPVVRIYAEGFSQQGTQNDVYTLKNAISAI
jgi:phosphoglucomutase